MSDEINLEILQHLDMALFNCFNTLFWFRRTAMSNYNNVKIYKDDYYQELIEFVVCKDEEYKIVTLFTNKVREIANKWLEKINGAKNPIMGEKPELNPVSTWFVSMTEENGNIIVRCLIRAIIRNVTDQPRLQKIAYIYNTDQSH